MFSKHKNILRNLKKILFAGVMLLAVITTATAQEADNVLSGKIVDKDGNPISGAIINVSEMSRIAVTDEDGIFHLKKVNPNDELIISCLGYLQKTAVADFGNDLEIELEEETDIYKQTIAVPFSRVPKKFLVNSTSTVYGEELVKHPVTVLQNTFTATVTGVETIESNSEPGWSETDLYIRGVRTMNSDARSPLIIVDDMERDLSFLDAYPIETITILKDAAATAIYGMRGANGVVLVTTKRGEPGKTKFEFTQEFGYTTPSGIPESQNSYNYALTVNQANYLDGLDPAYTDDEIQHYKEVVNGTLDEQYKYKYFNSNWNDILIRDLSPQQRTNLSVSGGNKAIKYYLSFSHLYQEGMYDPKWTEWNDGYSTQHKLNRYNLRSNIDIDVNKVLSLSLDLGGRIDLISQPNTDTWTIFTYGTTENLPIYPIFTPNGEWYGASANSSKNAAALVAEGGIDYNRRRNLYSNVSADLNLDFITEGLGAKVIVGFDAYNTFEYTQDQWYDAYDYDMDSGTYDDPDSYTYTQTSTGSSLDDAVTNAREMYYNINIVGQVDYKRIFGKHNVSATGMVRSYKNVVTGYESSNRYVSFGGILNYIYDNKYILQATGTYQGCDNFSSENRWGFFPGASVGWLLSEENWLKSSKMDLLKLRASIGRAGQSDIGVDRYPYQSEYTEGSGYNFGKSQSYLEGAYESTTGNDNILWEISDMVNFGVDFDFKRRMLYGSVDVFKEWRSQILVSPSSIPDFYGSDVPDSSIGEAETKGFEVTLGHDNKIGDFSYSIQGLLTFNTNKVIYEDETDPAEPYQAETGRKIDQPLLFIKSQWASDESKISSSAAEVLEDESMYPYLSGTQLGNAVYVDKNGDGAIDTDDQYPHGYTSIPELIPTVRLGVGWKGFDARVIMTAYLNRTVACRENMDHGFGWGGTSTHEVTKTWGYYTDDPTDSRNINALYPRLSTTFSDVDRNYPYNTSTVWYRNGNFLSLRNIEFGYSLPTRLISKINMTKCRFYFSGYNLKNWSHFDSNFDAETPTNYLWAYPKVKSFSLGVNVTF